MIRPSLKSEVAGQFQNDSHCMSGATKGTEYCILNRKSAIYGC